MQLGNTNYNGTVGNFSTLNIGGTLVSTGRYPIESWRVWNTVEEAKSFVMYNGADATAFVGMILVVTTGTGKGVYVLDKVGNDAKTNNEFDDSAWTKLLDNQNNGQYLKSVTYIDSTAAGYEDSDSDTNDVGVLQFTFITDGGEEEIVKFDLNSVLSETTINAILQNCAVKNNYIATVSVGNIAAGTPIAAGTTIEQLLKDILCQEVWATGSTNPTAAITFKAKIGESDDYTTSLNGKTLEIGTLLKNITYDGVTFTDGKIGSYSGTTPTQINAGCEQDGNPTVVDGTTPVNQPYAVIDGEQELAKYNVAYTQSNAVTQSNLGTPATGDNASHAISIAAGSTAAVTCKVTGRYKAWVKTLNYESLSSSSTLQQILTALGVNNNSWLGASGQQTFGNSGTISAGASQQVYGFFPSTHKMTGTQMNSAVEPVVIKSDIEYSLPNGTTINYTLAYWPAVSQTYNNVKVVLK